MQGGSQGASLQQCRVCEEEEEEEEEAWLVGWEHGFRTAAPQTRRSLLRCGSQASHSISSAAFAFVVSGSHLTPLRIVHLGSYSLLARSPVSGRGEPSPTCT